MSLSALINRSIFSGWKPISESINNKCVAFEPKKPATDKFLPCVTNEDFIRWKDTLSY